MSVFSKLISTMAVRGVCGKAFLLAFGTMTLTVEGPAPAAAPACGAASGSRRMRLLSKLTTTQQSTHSPNDRQAPINLQTEIRSEPPVAALEQNMAWAKYSCLLHTYHIHPVSYQLSPSPHRICILAQIANRAHVWRAR